jgi:hypothetical protein
MERPGTSIVKSCVGKYGPVSTELHFKQALFMYLFLLTTKQKSDSINRTLFALKKLTETLVLVVFQCSRIVVHGAIIMHRSDH